MAGLKKPTRKRDASNPNTVLVVFLVFFVLLSIGLGIGMYYGYAGQEKLRTSTKDEILKAQANKLGEDMARLMERDLRLAIVGNLDAEDLNSWKTMLPEGLNDAGKFKDETKARPIFKKMRDENIALLGPANENTGYQTTYKAKILKLEQETKDAQASMTKAQAEAAQTKKDLDKLQLESTEKWNKAMAEIKKGIALARKDAQAKTEFMTKQIDFNDELQKQLSGIADKHGEEIAKLKGQIRILDTEKKKLEEKLKDAASLFVPRSSSDPHALLLDTSKGKTIWDHPRGKIARVDLDNRQVVINIGSNAGVKPEMAFNVFGGSWKGQAEGMLKGTVEVIRVLDGSTSVARITSLYDASGSEIGLNDQAIGRIQREASNLIKKDDLLFNLTLGAHVFIAGAVHWNGPPATTPAGQMRNLRDFISILESQGVKIDGYIDLTDGKIVGGITPETRYVVRGDSLAVERKAKKDDEEKAEAGGREKMVNDAMLAVRNEAIEKGLFIISAENLANVIGYRRPRSANDLEVSTFRPTLPNGPAAGN